MKYIIKYKTMMGIYHNIVIEAKTKFEAIRIFNSRSKYVNVEIKEVKEMEEKLEVNNE